MEKIKQTTADTVEQNIEKIAKLFPNVITETKDDNGKIEKAIDFEKLKQELSKEIVKGEESYSFTWVGKKQAIIDTNTPTNKTLRPCKQDSVNWDKTENVYIEGDNLEVLKILQETYLNKIKMIYIDPPYNTGKDFIYKDNFEIDKEEYEQELNLRDEEGNKQFKENNDSNPRFHSDWCSMMYSRLKIARNLLADDGSIFVSIDYNEFANMKKLMDEIFGEENFQREIIWRIGWLSGYKTTAPNFIRNHDTILFYSKNNTQFSFNKEYLLNKDFKPLVKKEPRLNQKLEELGLNKKQQEDLLNFINHENRTDKYPLEDTWNCNEYDDLNSIAIVSFSGEKISKILEINQEFKGQKSVKMLQRLIRSITLKDDIVLDFFSGTASTAHAVMQQNSEDNKNRKFIMVQLPEQCDKESEAFKAGYKNICEIGKERIRRAGKKIVEQTGKTDLDIGFRVFKLDESNMKDVYFSPDKYNQDMLEEIESNIKEDRNSEDLLFSCMLNWGLELSLPHKIEKIENNEIHIVNENELIACFDTNISENVVKKIADKQPLRVVFRDNSFGNDSDRINVEEIFKLKSPNTKIKIL